MNGAGLSGFSLWELGGRPKSDVSRSSMAAGRLPGPGGAVPRRAGSLRGRVRRVGIAPRSDAEFAMDVRYQVRQGLVHAGQILARKTALHVLVRSHAHEHGVEFRGETVEGDVAADVDTQSKLHAHAFHDLAALLDHVFFELEWRDPEGEQAADLRVPVEDHGSDAVTHQDVGAGQTGGTRADHGDALGGAHDIAHVGLPALFERFVGDVLLDGSDADGADAVIQRAGPLAQPILGTDAPAHFGQRIGLMGKLGRLEQLAVIDQRQPVRECNCGPGHFHSQNGLPQDKQRPACAAAVSALYCE